jgi:hypothetical protein
MPSLDAGLPLPSVHGEPSDLLTRLGDLLKQASDCEVVGTRPTNETCTETLLHQGGVVLRSYVHLDTSLPKPSVATPSNHVYQVLSARHKNDLCADWPKGKC